MLRTNVLAVTALFLSAGVALACGGGGGGGSPGGGGGGSSVAMGGGGYGQPMRMMTGPGSDYYDMAMQQQAMRMYQQQAMARAAAKAQEQQAKLDSRIALREKEQARLAASRAKRNGQKIDGTSGDGTYANVASQKVTPIHSKTPWYAEK